MGTGKEEKEKEKEDCGVRPGERRSSFLFFIVLLFLVTSIIRFSFLTVSLLLSVTIFGENANKISETSE